jgi:hypothetical protein
MSRLVISQTAISKSICGNLNRRLKKRGMREASRRDEADADAGAMPPNDDGAAAGCWRGRDMCGFMASICQLWRSGLGWSGFRMSKGRQSWLVRRGVVEDGLSQARVTWLWQCKPKNLDMANFT